MMLGLNDAYVDFVEECEREERVRRRPLDLDALIDSPRFLTEVKAVSGQGQGGNAGSELERFIDDSPRTVAGAKALGSQAPGEGASSVLPQLEASLGSPLAAVKVRTFDEEHAGVTRQLQQLDQHIDHAMIAEAKATNGHGHADGASSARAVSALIALVRKEVRTAVEQEFNALRMSFPATSVAFEGDGSWARAHSGELRELSACSFSGAGSTATSPQQLLAGKTGSEQGYSNVSTSATASGSHSGSHDVAMAVVTDELCRQTDYWERAWKHEAELRAEGDQEVEARLFANVTPKFEDLEARMEHTEQSLNSLAKLQTEWQAELRAEGDLEVEARLVASLAPKLVDMEARMEQAEASVNSLAKLQMDLSAEAKLRQDADARLQAFLRDFRQHVMGEVEDVWAKHQQLCAAVEGMRELMGQVVELVQTKGVPLSLPPRVTPALTSRQQPNAGMPHFEAVGPSPSSKPSTSATAAATAAGVITMDVATRAARLARERTPSPPPLRSPHVAGPDELEVALKVPGDSPKILRRAAIP